MIVQSIHYLHIKIGPELECEEVTNVCIYNIRVINATSFTEHNINLTCGKNSHNPSITLHLPLVMVQQETTDFLLYPLIKYAMIYIVQTVRVSQTNIDYAWKTRTVLIEI